MKLPTPTVIASGFNALSCLQEGQCREVSGRVQVCASSYWQDMVVVGYSCQSGLIEPVTQRHHDDSTSAIVGLPVETTCQSGHDRTPAAIEASQQVPTSLSIYPPPPTVASSVQVTLATTGVVAQPSSVSQEGFVSEKGDVGFWYCKGEKPPTRNDRAFTASYTFGGSMASVYYPEKPLFRCDIQPPASNYFAAVWTRYAPDEIAQPQPKNCNDWLALENPKNGRTATALVIDRCASCVGVAHQMSDRNVSDSLVNGATVDLSPDLFAYLYEGAVEGVFDILYNGSIYGGSWDGDPDELKDPFCDD